MKLSNKVLRNILKIGYTAAEFFWENSTEKSGQIEFRPPVRIFGNGVFTPVVISPWAKTTAVELKKFDDFYGLQFLVHYEDDIFVSLYPDKIEISPSYISLQMLDFALDDGIKGNKADVERFLTVNKLGKTPPLERDIELLEKDWKRQSKEIHELEKKLREAEKGLSEKMTLKEAKNQIIQTIREHYYKGLLKRPIFSYRRLKAVVAKMIEEI